MKKNFIYATLSAIALVGAMSLSACSTSEDVEDVNPTFDGKAVKTQFTISLPQNVAKTRQTAGTVQSNGALNQFRGMNNIVLYPFTQTAVANEIPINNSSTKIGDGISLVSMIKPTTSTVSNEIPAFTTDGTGLLASSNSVLYKDVTIPVGTGSFLFYGKAIDNGTDKFYNGSLTMTSVAPINPSNIAFDLDPTYTASSASTVGAALAEYLTQIAQAGGFDSGTKKSVWEATDNTGLKDLYDKFKTLKAGSSLTVQAAVQDLYTSIKNNTDAVSVAIKNAILSTTTTEVPYSTVYAKDDNSDGTLEFQDNIGNSATTYFPADVNLPDGAAYLSYDDDTNTFTQSTEGAGNTGMTAAYAAYVYPASLYYYGNSGVKTATASQEALYNSTNSWAQITGNEAFTGNAVGPSTRSVAIIDPIEYAVGRLDMKVNALTTTDDATDATKKLMYDKKGEAYDAKNGFTVTGVLIGGQKQVGFDFTPNTSASDMTIYDNITKSQTGTTLTVTPSAASVTNYTLALETAPTTPVYVAVEFVNNGADFEGADGVIPAGCKFYLVGKLDPAGTSNEKTAYNDDANSYATGVLTTGNRVFMQDYITKANFGIAQGLSKTNESFPVTGNNKGLGAAYNIIPDLRTPQMELGLSVNLEWKSGIEFDVTF